MLYDRRDFGLLRLAGTYHWLPLAPLRALSSLRHLYREAELLSTLGLLSFSRSNQYLMPSPEGYQFLASMEIDCHAPTKRPYAQSSALRRRLEVGTVLLTCLGAGIEPADDKVDRLKRQPVFLPAFALRGGDGNLMNAAWSLGVGSCWINRAMELFDRPEGKELLKKWGLPETYRGVGNCILGYVEGDLPAPKPRKDGGILRV